MPFNTNLNYAVLVGVLCELATYFFGARVVPPNIQNDLVVLIPIVMGAVVSLLHTFVNHPANVQKLTAAMYANGINSATVHKILPLMLVALFLPILLASCASNGNGGLVIAPSVSASVQKLGAFTLADLANADAIAVKAGDDQGHACYSGLIVFVQQQQAAAGGASTSTVSGAFSAFEAARTTLQGANNLISATQIKALENACGPLVIDTQNNAASFLANLAGLGQL